MRSNFLLLFSLLLVIASSASAEAIYGVLLNTSPLQGHDAGPFAIDVQLTGTLGNTATFKNFSFGTGGYAVGGTQLFGDATGDLASGFTLDDHTSFFNEFIQAFLPGPTLSFTLTLTTESSPASFPDLLSFAILDRSGKEIPTLGLGAIGSDVLLLANIDSGQPTLQRFSTDPSRPPFAGGGPITMGAPVVTPEPAVHLLMGTGLIAIAIFARRYRA